MSDTLIVTVNEDQFDEADKLMRQMLNIIEGWLLNGHNTLTYDQILQMRKECLEDLLQVQLARYEK
jgi:hypothetical protein